MITGNRNVKTCNYVPIINVSFILDVFPKSACWSNTR